MIVLGIESSCDDTAAAVVKDGRHILSSVVTSQISVHHPYGGVVPELASRKHIEAIHPLVRTAVAESGLSFGDIDAVAATQGPGLVGSLLVGFTFAKAFAWALNRPFVGVNHLNGHIHSLFLTAEDPKPTFPFVALLASGGHTAIYHVLSHDRIDLMGQTRDDAVGEAYDKVAKVLGLGYPGGSVIERLAAGGKADAIQFPRAYLDKSAYDFSFSGIKTAVARYCQTHADRSADETADIAAGFQEAVVEVLCFKLLAAAEDKNCRDVALAGGVAANQRLRNKLTADGAKRGLRVHIPPIRLCGDNAAMVAAAGYHEASQGRVIALDADVYSRNRH